MNYPPVDIVRKTAEDDEDKNDPNANRMGFATKKKEEEEEVKELDNEEDDDTCSLKHLFKFACDLT